MGALSRSCSARSPMRTVLVLQSLVFSASVANAMDALPIADGAYMRSASYCEQFRKGELDSIEFSVLKGGHAYEVPEVGCVIASVHKLRTNRYAVEADCLETGNPFQRSFILDVEGEQTIRIDGEQLTACEHWAVVGKPSQGTDLPGIPIVPANKKNETKGETTTATSPARLIRQWQAANENCRGGSGDDPQTVKACGARDVLADQLEAAKWCYGKNGQSGYQYKWHRCQKGSIHH
ncbi:hypothetical protein LB533_03375 [Mesorhizobium sp. BR1-1-13]|uniref:hypothetical protein n=1 Tax=Mesorhizobium sp. BR1-1-13 TaxID=2876656 RepID=UPI001CD144CC|nr:hypothetical protein [Mesorhizobium sp. BR1-1-13]MBZ9940140.1 hypothetical protein [Mesorhizobium sp. BR1-1-13]